MSNLYKLSESCEQLRQMLENIDEESAESADVRQACLDTLEGLSIEFDEKAEAAAIIIKQFSADAKAMKEEEDRLRLRRKAKENKAEWLKSYLLLSLQKVGKTRLETTKAAISIRNNAESVRIDDPQRFIEWALTHNNTLLTYKPPEISKTAVKEALKIGNMLPGAELVRSQSLQIR